MRTKQKFTFRVYKKGTDSEHGFNRPVYVGAYDSVTDAIRKLYFELGQLFPKLEFDYWDFTIVGWTFDD